MPGLDLDIVQHKLPLKPECPPIKQKLRRMKPEMALKIKEVEKQFNAGFLTVAKYPNGWQMLCLYQRKTEKYECV